MKLKLALCTMAMSAVLAMPAFAGTHLGSGTAPVPEDISVLFEQKDSAEFLGNKNSRATSYDLTSSKNTRNKGCKCGMEGKDFQCYGWVNIVDKKSKTPLDHSTTAAISDYYDPQEYHGAVRVTGNGKVSATSEYVHGFSVARIFWDWL